MFLRRIERYLIEHSTVRSFLGELRAIYLSWELQVVCWENW